MTNSAFPVYFEDNNFPYFSRGYRKKDNVMKYIRGLDSIRAIAAVIVVFHHWFPELHVENYIDGVAIFFVLSGYLITNILFQNKKECAGEFTGNLSVFKSFFFRRALRIFPLYYIVVLVVFLIGHKSQANGFMYYLTYASNFYIYREQQWGEFTHLWSLAVEEQFYFVWPWIILFIRNRYILPIILFFISFSITFELVIPTNPYKFILTPLCFFALGLGALLSWLVHFNYEKLIAHIRLIVFAGSLLMVFLFLKRVQFSASNFDVFVCSSIITFYLVLYIVLNKENEQFIFSNILNNSLMVKLGKMSYGIYVFHHVLPYYTYDFLPQLNAFFFPEFISQRARTLLTIENFAILIIISSLSWQFVEQPFLKLKERFNYRNDRRQTLNVRVKEAVV